jgi:hypothetical protein
MQGKYAGFWCPLRLYALSISIHPFQMIHPTDLVENQTVLMNPSRRTRERSVATNKFKLGHGSYASRLQQLCFTIIWLLWTAGDNDEEAKVQNTKSQKDAALGQRLKFCLERSI